MPSRPYRTNPTGIKRVDRSMVTVSVHRDATTKIDSFSVEKVELISLGLPAEATVTIVAYSGFDEKRVEIGHVGTISLPKNIQLDDLDTSGLIFRLLVREPTGHKLLGSCEGIRPADPDNAGRTPLLSVSYEPLGERMWDVKLSGGNPPVLRVNDNPDLDLRGSFEARDPQVRGMIVPQAYEQALIYLALNPATDEDPSQWQNVWREYLEARSVEVPDGPLEIDAMESIFQWARETATHFAREIMFVTLAIEKKRNASND